MSGLEHLLEQATPGPWRPSALHRDYPDGGRSTRQIVNGEYPDGRKPATNAVAEILEYTPDQELAASCNARLIALAPDMARLLIDMNRQMKDLRDVFLPHLDRHERDATNALLARFAVLNQKAGTA